MTIHIGKTYYDILPPEQKSLWPSLHKLSELGFVLYRGTAIALQCGHRNSVDFDFFHLSLIRKKKFIQLFRFSGARKYYKTLKEHLPLCIKKTRTLCL